MDTLAEKPLSVLHAQLVGAGDEGRVVVIGRPQDDGGHELAGVGNLHAGSSLQLPPPEVDMDSSSTMTGTLSSVMLATGMQVWLPKPLPVMVMVSLGSASVLLAFS